MTLSGYKINKIRALKEQGESISSIAEKIHVSRPVVLKYLNSQQDIVKIPKEYTIPPIKTPASSVKPPSTTYDLYPAYPTPSSPPPPVYIPPEDPNLLNKIMMMNAIKEGFNFINENQKKQNEINQKSYEKEDQTKKELYKAINQIKQDLKVSKKHRRIKNLEQRLNRLMEESKAEELKKVNDTKQQPVNPERIEITEPKQTDTTRCTTPDLQQKIKNTNETGNQILVAPVPSETKTKPIITYKPTKNTNISSNGIISLGLLQGIYGSMPQIKQMFYTLFGIPLVNDTQPPKTDESICIGIPLDSPLSDKNKLQDDTKPNKKGDKDIIWL